MKFRELYNLTEKIGLAEALKIVKKNWYHSSVNCQLELKRIKMKVRTFKQLHQDMRDDRDIYPKRGSSLEEICVSNLMDVVHHFDSIKDEIYFSIRYKEEKESFKFFEQIMHQKFDIIEELLKECNIEQYERDYKEKEINANATNTDNKR